MVVNACNFIKQNSTDMEDVEISESVLDRLHKLSLEKNSQTKKDYCESQGFIL